MNKLNNEFDQLQDVINDCQGDVTKFIEGNNSAGTRVRKAMQTIKALAQGIRVEVQDHTRLLYRLCVCLSYLYFINSIQPLAYY